MTAWKVKTPLPLYEGVSAYDATVEHGALVFSDQAGRLVLAYAPGQWEVAFRDGDDEPAS